MDPRFPEEEKPALRERTREGIRQVVAGTQLFQRFTLQKLLGHGAMSVVWLAHDDRFDRLVALKLLPESPNFDATACEDLRRETERSLVLTHANIVRIFDFIADEGIAAIAMEYVDGTTLSDARSQKRSKCFGIPELVPWVNSLCDALAYAHESTGVIHRDLRPANILVDSRAKLKITNFGTACSLRNSMRRLSGQTTHGTPNYMSPQQLLGEEPAPSDDIYALGVTLYEMLSSKPPFYNGDIELQVREVVAPPIAQRRVTLGIAGEPIPKRWEETIAACLAKNPEQRPQSAAEVAQRLRLGGTIRLTTARDIARPVFERYVKLGALAGGVAALVAAAVIASRPHSAASRPNAGLVFKSETPTGYAIESDVKRVRPPKTEEAPTEPAPIAGPPNATLQLATTPAGASFSIYPGVVTGAMALATAPLRRGATPQSVADLPPGPYTIFFHNQGWPDDRAEIALQPGETLPVDLTFPHGSAAITSTPDGAEILAGDKSLGLTPLTVDLPLGKQELVARHPDFPKKTETVTIERDKTATVTFQLRARSRSSGKAKTPDSAWDKFSNSLKKVFSSKPPPKKKREPVTLPTPVR